MRVWIGRLAIMLGAFAVVAAAVAMVWGKDAAKRTPLNIDSYTRLTGTASGVLAKSETPVPVKYITHTQVDPDASDDEVVVMDQVGCITVDEPGASDWCIDEKGNVVVEDDDPRMVQFSREKFAIDRVSALPVEDQGAYIPDEDAVLPYEGLVTKFPFDVEKKDYEFWDGTLGETILATYEGEREIDGLTTYEFQLSVPATETEIAEGTTGTYEAAQTIWTDPKTGAYVDQKGSQTVTLPDGTVVLDIEVTYTDETVEANVADAKSNGRSLWLLGTALPIGGAILGLVLIAVGLLLQRRRDTGSGPVGTAPRQTAKV